MIEIPQKVYKMILNNLHVTYTPDKSTEQRIKSEIRSGMNYIRKYCSPEADFEPGSDFGQMLCDYVLRAESGATETFKTDFAEDITAARLEHETKEYAEAKGYA